VTINIKRFFHTTQISNDLGGPKLSTSSLSKQFINLLSSPMKKGHLIKKISAFFSFNAKKKNEFNGQKKNPYAYTPNKFARILDLKTFFQGPTHRKLTSIRALKKDAISLYLLQCSSVFDFFYERQH